MDQLDIPGHYDTINKAANLFLHNFGPGFTQTAEGHIQTDIAGAASVAGTVLLRSTVPDLARYEPGAVLLSEIHDREEHIGRFMSNVIYSMNLEPRGGWTMPIPDEHQPMLSILEMTHRLENPLYHACSEAGLHADFYSHAAALTAIKLVAAGVATDRLALDTGKALAAYHLAGGCRTVPYPPLTD